MLTMTGRQSHEELYGNKGTTTGAKVATEEEELEAGVREGLEGVQQTQWIYVARALAGLGLLNSSDDVEVRFDARLV